MAREWRADDNFRWPWRSVLVVDDEAGVRSLLTAWIRVLGHHSYQAADAERALATMRMYPVDVALIDICMPGRDGVWLIRQVQERFPNTAIIIATGLTAMDPLVTLSPGIAGYVVKPFEFESFAAAIDSAIASQTAIAPHEPSKWNARRPLLTEGVFEELALVPDPV